MKFILLLTCTVFLCVRNGYSITIDTLPTSRKYSEVKLTNGSLVRGYIMGATDSTLSLLSRKDYFRGEYLQSRVIPAEEIETVTKNFKTGFTAGEGIALGFGTGFLAGFSLGLSNPGDCTDAYGNPVRCDFGDRLFATKNFVASLIIGCVLGGIGLIIGLTRPKKQRLRYDIKGKRENLISNKIGLSF